jgi:hypothetical protein
MKFTTKIVVILFIILVSLGVFLYFLNDLTKKQAAEEEKSKRIQTEEAWRKKQAKIQKRMEKNQEMTRLFESFLAMPFNQVDSEYGRGDSVAEVSEPPKEAEPEGCPDILIHRGDVVVLYNSKSPGKPVEVFKNLDDYALYVHRQQAAGVFCPVLYLRKEIDLQGRDTYRAYPLYIPHQVSIYDQYTSVDGGIKKKEDEPKIAPLPSVHYPIEDGDRWSNDGVERPSMPMPPPFLKSMTTWEVHHMPPLYVEGGLPPVPIEQKKSNVVQEIANIKEIPTPMGHGSVIAVAEFPEQGAGIPTGRVVNFDPYAMKQDAYIPSDKVNTPKPGSYSDNAADPNWGGVLYTSANVEAGKYDNNAVKPALYPNLGYV